jgi:acetylornithine deacetylase/succinyl-diaminopimelate desuccinylase-like protein
MKNIQTLTQEAISLLKDLIETPSYSSQEDQTALLIENWFTKIIFGLLIRILMLQNRRFY